jgi:hypothetical protein
MLKDSRFQFSICVGPIRDKTIENLHHYMVAQDRVVCYHVAKIAYDHVIFFIITDYYWSD